MSNIQELEKWINHKLKLHTKTDFLNVISFVCLLFGLFTLFVGTIQYNGGVCIDGLMKIMIGDNTLK